MQHVSRVPQEHLVIVMELEHVLYVHRVRMHLIQRRLNVFRPVPDTMWANQVNRLKVYVPFVKSQLEGLRLVPNVILNDIPLHLFLVEDTIHAHMYQITSYITLPAVSYIYVLPVTCVILTQQQHVQLTRTLELEPTHAHPVHVEVLPLEQQRLPTVRV
jgi:hypothetical protein